MQSSQFEVTENIKSLAMIRSRTVVGLDAVPVVVEVHLANGLPNFSTVGLPETAVKESKDRVRGAIINSGFEFPAKRITVNLAPADLPKAGGRFDLPIALGILVASGQIPGKLLASKEFVGELALSGHLRKISGVLPTVLASANQQHELVIPQGNQAEAALCERASVYSASHLLEVCQFLAGQQELSLCQPQQEKTTQQQVQRPDLSDVKGQLQARRALEIAAAGGHSMLFIGPPGTGKSMLASRLISVMPELSVSEALETAAIQSISDGEFDAARWRARPYRAPHHSASSAALVGGGSNPKPGEISKAHNGVLFLDELTEFSRAALEQLREPLESGVVNIARANQSVTYPAGFLLVAACNPCKCGYFGDGTARCQCTPQSIETYRNKLSGPMLDRIDLHVTLPRVDIQTLQSGKQGESSDAVKTRVVATRSIQLSRQNKLNSKMSNQDIEKHCGLDKDNLDYLETICERLQLSARAYHRILKLARTIADMESSKNIKRAHLAEAASYRCLDRQQSTYS